MDGVETISLVDLARELKIKPDRIPPLIIEGYLRLAESGSTPYNCMVEKPAPAALEWLKSMYAPLKKRPFVPIEDVATIFKLTPTALRQYMLHYNIPSTLDPLFGELVSIQALRRLHQCFLEARSPLRMDRGEIALFLAGIAGIPFPKKRNFDQRLSPEVTRIAKLPEPQRTMRALKLVTDWQDAEKVIESLKQYREHAAIRNADCHGTLILRKIGILSKALRGKGSWEMPEKLAKGGSIPSHRSFMLAKRGRLSLMRYWGEQYLEYLRTHLDMDGNEIPDESDEEQTEAPGELAEGSADESPL